MLYIFFGEDDFSLKEALEEIKDQIGREGLSAGNITVLSGRQLSLAQLMNTCDTVPFLSEKRLVIVEGLLSRFESRRGGGRRSPRSPAPLSGEGEWLDMKRYVRGMPASTVLVLVDRGVGRQNPLLMALASEGEVREFRLLREGELGRWIRERVARVGGSISAEGVQALVDLVGGNLWVLQSEIEKLGLYKGEGQIEEGDVRLMVSHAREASIFALVDAIMEDRPSLAVALLHQLLDEGMGAPYLLVMLTRQLRLVILAKELALEELPLGEVMRRVGLTSEYALRKTLGQAQAHSMGRVEEMYRKLLEVDVSIKTGRLREDLALDLLIADLGEGSPRS